MTQLRVAQKGTKRSLRARNDVLVLQSVAAGGGEIARADIVRETGLPSATVSAIVGNLIDRRLVRESGHGDSRGGKPRVLLELDREHHRFVGVHVGRGRVTASLLTLSGRPEQTVRLPHLVGDDTLTVTANAVRRLADSFDGQLSGIGVAVPGIVSGDGVIREAINYGWRMVPLGEELSERCGDTPVHVVNDANAVALSEVALSRQWAVTVVLLWIGTGVGAGIVLDGRLYEGPEFRSGEIGHIDAGVSTRCRCGLVGCLETVASMPGLLGDASEQVVAAYLGGADDADSRALDERIRRGARELARLASMFAASLDITEFVVGGPIVASPIGPPLLRATNEVLELRAMPGFPVVSLRFSTLGSHSVVVGAAAHAMRQEFGVMLTMPGETTEQHPNRPPMPEVHRHG
ncbi:ROK family transcriptional regulator [Kutzneria viridogrisea]|uniref:ROK family protein n=2 Tax=Kutzneria TaxID=43356 RepID=W5W0Q7_9PSEU|nr:ROK family transcriptional regulator [Kutzneria albida]AHH94748.1 ROK family protein [Kutzneria albida DSM 43870]MBA8930417.1 putative NBD/HSP70 family sugar kinase [Kutzneria viridogrisea]